MSGLKPIMCNFTLIKSTSLNNCELLIHKNYTDKPFCPFHYITYMGRLVYDPNPDKNRILFKKKVVLLLIVTTSPVQFEALYLLLASLTFLSLSRFSNAYSMLLYISIRFFLDSISYAFWYYGYRGIKSDLSPFDQIHDCLTECTVCG